MWLSISSSVEIRNGLLGKISESRLVPAFWFLSSSELGVQKQDTVLDEAELEDAVPRHSCVLQALVDRQSAGPVES